MKKALIFPQFGKSGGTRTYLKNLINFYLLNDYQIVLAIDEDYCDNEILEFLSKFNIKIVFLLKNIQTGIFSRFPSSVFYDLIVGTPIILKEKPDIVLISVGTTGKFVGLMLLPLKLIYILHTYPTCIRPNLFYRLLFSISLNNNKRILTVSKFSKTQIIKRWLADKKQEYVEFIYNFSNLENHPQVPKDTGKKIVKKILTLGHVVEYKNPDIWYAVAVKTIEKCHGNVEFLWAGEGELLDFYREKVKMDNIPQIKFLGFEENVVELYNQCDIYFQPSQKESHGIAVVDAMLMARPCVVSNVGGLPESVIEGKTGYVVDPVNVDEMVSRLIHLMENEDLRVSMGKAGKEYYENTFSYKWWVQEMKRLNEILGCR